MWDIGQSKVLIGQSKVLNKSRNLYILNSIWIQNLCIETISSYLVLKMHLLDFAWGQRVEEGASLAQGWPSLDPWHCIWFPEPTKKWFFSAVPGLRPEFLQVVPQKSFQKPLSVRIAEHGVCRALSSIPDSSLYSYMSAIGCHLEFLCSYSFPFPPQMRMASCCQKQCSSCHDTH